MSRSRLRGDEIFAPYSTRCGIGIIVAWIMNTKPYIKMMSQLKLIEEGDLVPLLVHDPKTLRVYHDVFQCVIKTPTEIQLCAHDPSIPALQLTTQGDGFEVANGYEIAFDTKHGNIDDDVVDRCMHAVKKCLRGDLTWRELLKELSQAN